MSEHTFETDARLAEYKELRAEARDCLAQSQHNRNFAFVITLGVAGAAFSVAHPYLLFFIAAILILLLWHHDLVRMRSIFRLTTYIELNIEPKLPGLDWCGLIAKNLRKRTTGRMAFLGRADFAVLSVVHALCGVCTLARVNAWAAFFAFMLFLALCGRMTYRSVTLWSTARDEERRHWQDILGEK